MIWQRNQGTWKEEKYFHQDRGKGKKTEVEQTSGQCCVVWLLMDVINRINSCNNTGDEKQTPQEFQVLKAMFMIQRHAFHISNSTFLIIAV